MSNKYTALSYKRKNVKHRIEHLLIKTQQNQRL